jgi:hypothetical protein
LVPLAHRDLRRYRPAAVWRESLGVLIARTGAKCQTVRSRERPATDLDVLSGAALADCVYVG